MKPTHKPWSVIAVGKGHNGPRTILGDASVTEGIDFYQIASHNANVAKVWRPADAQEIIEAVNAHDALVAENNRLSSLESYFLEAQASYDRVKAENERLREALEKLVNAFHYHLIDDANDKDVDVEKLCPCWTTSLAEARAALASE